MNVCRVWGDRTISHHNSFAVRVVVSETRAETGTAALPAPGQWDQQPLGAGLELLGAQGAVNLLGCPPTSPGLAYPSPAPPCQEMKDSLIPALSSLADVCLFSLLSSSRLGFFGFVFFFFPAFIFLLT